MMSFLSLFFNHHSFVINKDIYCFLGLHVNVLCVHVKLSGNTVLEGVCIRLK